MDNINIIGMQREAFDPLNKEIQQMTGDTVQTMQSLGKIQHQQQVQLTQQDELAFQNVWNTFKGLDAEGQHMMIPSMQSSPKFMALYKKYMADVPLTETKQTKEQQAVGEQKAQQAAATEEANFLSDPANMERMQKLAVQQEQIKVLAQHEAAANPKILQLMKEAAQAKQDFEQELADSPSGQAKIEAEKKYKISLAEKMAEMQIELEHNMAAKKAETEGMVELGRKLIPLKDGTYATGLEVRKPGFDKTQLLTPEDLKSIRSKSQAPRDDIKMSLYNLNTAYINLQKEINKISTSPIAGPMSEMKVVETYMPRLADAWVSHVKTMAKEDPTAPQEMLAQVDAVKRYVFDEKFRNSDRGQMVYKKLYQDYQQSATKGRSPMWLVVQLLPPGDMETQKRQEPFARKLFEASEMSAIDSSIVTTVTDEEKDQ